MNKQQVKYKLKMNYIFGWYTASDFHTIFNVFFRFTTPNIEFTTSNK